MIGIDGCRAGWCGVAIVGERVEWAVSSSLVEVVGALEALAPAVCGADIAIDMPLGLPSGRETRACDDEARRRLGPRRASIFAAPPRAVLAARDHTEANSISRTTTGRGLSLQSWNLVVRIRELDALLRTDPRLVSPLVPRLATRIFESHPELCFASFAGAPCAHPKKSPEGRAERRRVLEALRPTAPAELDRARARFQRSAVKDDDLVDAFVLALVAGLSPSQRETLPTEPERDAHGLPMAITAPQRAPLTVPT